MEEWKIYRLGDLVDFQNGYAFKSSKFLYDGKYKIIRIKELKNGLVKFFEDTVSISDEPNEILSKILVNKGDVIFALTGDPVSKQNANSWVGRVSLYTHDIPAYLNQRTCKIIQCNNVVPQYVYYYFRQYENLYSLASKATGSASQANISTKILEDTEILLPSLSVQKKMVAILASLDNKIALNRRINDNLEQQVQALFKLWFVDNSNPNWKETSLSEVASFVGGYSYTGEELTDCSNIAMATIKNFGRNGGFKTDGFKEINPSAKLKECHYANLFDILVAHTDLTQNADVIGNAELLLTYGKYDSIIFSMDLVKVLPKETFPYRFLLAAMLKNKLFKGHCLGYVNGTTVLHLSKKALPDFEIRKPSDSESKMMDEVLASYYKRMAELLQENDRLISLRDTVLPTLISGELKINDLNS